MRYWNRQAKRTRHPEVRRRVGTYRPAVESLEVRSVPATPFFSAIGTDVGVPATVYLLNNQGAVSTQFTPFGPGFSGGVRVATGDVTGDGVGDLVVASGKGGVTAMLIYDGAALLANPSNPTPFRSFNPFGTGFAGGAFVAVGALDGGATGEIIVGADSGGGPQVNIYSPGLIQDNRFTFASNSFFAYPFANGVFFTGGVRVAAADVNGDGKADLITGAGPGGGPQINVYAGAANSSYLNFILITVPGTPHGLPVVSPPTPFVSFFGLGPGLASFAGGVYVSGGDVDRDGKAEVIVGAGPGGGPEVAFFSGATLAQAPSAVTPVTAVFGIQPPSFAGGVRVGLAEDQLPADSFGPVLVVGAGLGGGPQLDLFDARAILANPTNPPAAFAIVSIPPGNFTSGLFVSV